MMKKQIEGIRLLTKNEIRSILLLRPLEYLDVIRKIELFFLQKRNYVFKLPKKNTPVILLVSGGLDTSLMWGMLMKEFKLKVYPLFLRRGQIRTIQEEESVDFFYTYYRKKYPNLCEKPMKFNIAIPPHEIRWPLTKIGHIPIGKSPAFARGIPMYSSLLSDYAVQYAYFLEITKRLKTRTIFCGLMPSDAGMFSYETLTSLRVINQTICILTRDFSWQITSLALEKELNLFFNKDALILWSSKNGIPVERSYSCIEFDLYHCGVCSYCRLRRSYFKISSKKDFTIYISDNPPVITRRIINKLILSFKIARFGYRLLSQSISIFIQNLKYLYFRKWFYKNY